MSKKFTCSYMGACWYKIDGIEYRQKISTTDYERSVCNTGVFDREVLPCVGTVKAEHYPANTVFPSNDVMAEFPGYIAARWNPDTNQVETQGAPDVIADYRGNILAAKKWVEETEKLLAA